MDLCITQEELYETSIHDLAAYDVSVISKSTFLLLRMLLPLALITHFTGKYEEKGVSVTQTEQGLRVDTGCVTFTVNNNSQNIFISKKIHIQVSYASIWML